MSMKKHAKQTRDVHAQPATDKDFTAGDRQIFLEKSGRSKPDLAEMVARIPDGYRAEEVDLGTPVGREEW